MLPEATEAKPKLTVFRLCEVMLMGTLCSDAGLRPDLSKVSAVMDMPVPQDKQGAQRFNGMANFLSSFCKNFSTVTKPLSMLTQEGVQFLWSAEHKSAFNNVKALISKAATL